MPGSFSKAIRRRLQRANQILELTPDPKSRVRTFLRELIDPDRFGGDPDEQDLVSFKPNKEIYELITRDAP